jgi:ATP-binding cassette, subfamily F, member 1
MKKDISIENIIVNVPGKTLIRNTNLVVSYGHKYGLIGKNGLGKTTLLKHIDEKIIPIPKEIDIFCVEQEPTFDQSKTIYQIVLDANRKRTKLTNKLNELTELLETIEIEQIESITEEYNSIYEKLNAIDYDKDEPIIRRILYGLGFEHNQQDMPFSTFSGGFRARVSLARGLYMQPTLLLLDEPTNHLDLNSVIWLTNFLGNNWKKSLMIVSHDRYFLNTICTDIIHLENQILTYYTGNYDNFVKGYEQHLRNLEKEWKKIQNKVKEMRKKSSTKIEINKFLEKNAILEPPKPYRVNITFPEANEIKWPAITLAGIGFNGYDKTKPHKLFHGIDLSLFANEKITIVGKNGVGKSTLMKILLGKLAPSEGEIIKDSRLSIGYYHQHVADILPMNYTPLAYIKSLNSELTDNDARKILGSIGLPSNTHINLISSLSGGQKSRVVLSSLTALKKQHILILDEPTNHLDIESINSLIKAINNYNGAVIMITHNIDVIKETNSQIYELVDGQLCKSSFDEYYEKILVMMDTI